MKARIIFMAGLSPNTLRFQVIGRRVKLLS
jgi:hypothetical protein